MHNNASKPLFRGVYLFVKDLDRTLAFYQLLGLEVERVSDMFARANWDDKVFLEFGTADLTKSYDPGWSRPSLPPNCTLALEYGSDGEVDSIHHRAIQKGYQSHLEPTTPPWQSRFAILIDPDGNYVGLHGPRDLYKDRVREIDA